MRDVASKHTPDDTEAYRRIREGDIAERNAMVERHMGLAVRTAEYYAQRNPLMDIDDLIQEGRIGIIVALGKFDVDKGFRFSTYATWWIKHFVQRYVVSNHSHAASTSKKDTEAYLGESMPESDARLYELRCLSHHSLEKTIDGKGYAEILPSDDTPIEEQAELMSRWNSVLKALRHKSISDQQRAVMKLRYGIGGGKPHTHAEISEVLGISRQGVSLAERRCLKKLRAILEETDG